MNITIEQLAALIALIGILIFFVSNNYFSYKKELLKGPIYLPHEKPIIPNNYEKMPDMPYEYFEKLNLELLKKTIDLDQKEEAIKGLERTFAEYVKKNEQNELTIRNAFTQLKDAAVIHSENTKKLSEYQERILTQELELTRVNEENHILTNDLKEANLFRHELQERINELNTTIRTQDAELTRNKNKEI